MQDYTQFHKRRQALIESVKQHHDLSHGVIVLGGAYESEYMPFRQDSTFYYLTGINEPACVCLIWLSGETHVYVPQYPDFRSKWLVPDITPESSPGAYHVDGIYAAGVRQGDITVSMAHDVSAYENVIRALHDTVAADVPVCACTPDHPYAYVQQKLMLYMLARGLHQQPTYYDISPIVSRMRRKKSRDEVARIHQAASVTIMAHEAAACAIEPGKPEHYVQAAAEYILTECGARPAFPSIVASGHNSTILHYTANAAEIEAGDTVVVDIGAYKDHYAADVSRTYPARGQFSKDQAHVYEAVRDTQAYIASLLAPGYCIYNAEQPELSLYHCAQKRLQQHGYSEYFIHNIGHFLGLDVHDVGDVREPLEEGDVLTVEPGVYDADNRVGARIEDDYWIVKDGSVCLTDGLPTEQNEIERLAQRGFSELEEASEQHDE